MRHEIIMTKEEQTIWLNYRLSDVKTDRTLDELAIGYARYEALRRLSPHQYTELHRRNLAGERFDDMVDAMVADLGR